MVGAWLAGRSLSRGLPPPEPDRGGLRVDTGAESETCRWVFSAPGSAISDLIRTIDEPGYLVKLPAPSATLAALLTGRWRIETENWMMVAPALARSAPELPPGYRFAVREGGGVSHVRIIGPDGLLAATGYAAEVPGAFVYDRIITVAAHRRRGLGRALMARLALQRRDPANVDILTATADGRSLYEAIGWTVYAPWATASVPPA